MSICEKFFKIDEKSEKKPRDLIDKKSLKLDKKIKKN